LEKIKEKNKMTQKFETDKEQLANIALDLEKSIENIKIELEKSEDAGATSIGRILAEIFKKQIFILNFSSNN